VLLVTFHTAGRSAVAVGSHDDAADDDASDFRVATYGGSTADQRALGASDLGHWTESTTDAIPEAETVYLTETVTYRPNPSDCAAADTGEFGVDRNPTDEGERRIDDSANESVKSFSKDADVRGEYERQYGDPGRHPDRRLGRPAAPDADRPIRPRLHVAFRHPRRTRGRRAPPGALKPSGFSLPVGNRPPRWTSGTSRTPPAPSGTPSRSSQ
jgi:hypothetical protein